MAEIETRAAYLEDVPFIFATMLRSYRHASFFARKISNDVFYKYHHMFLDSCLKREKSTVIVAHPKGEPNVILGYVLSEERAEGHIVHYTYVKRSFRRLGVAKALWSTLDPKKQYIITHFTTDADWIVKKFNLVYNPYLL